MQRIETLTSAANPLLKDIRRAVERGTQTSRGFCVAEGFHLLEEALRSGSHIALVLASSTAAHRVKLGSNSRFEILPDKLFQSISGTENSQGVMALVRPPTWQASDLFSHHSAVVVMDEVQDPGNAGTIVRAAEAFGATGVVFTKGTASPHNPKTLRASMGSLFRLPYLSAVAPEEVAKLLIGFVLYSAVPWTGKETAAANADFRGPCALIVGSEASGVSPVIRNIAQPVAIPTTTVESLNAAVAASILLYEMRRQRS